MTIRKLIKTVVVLFFLFSVIIGLISINHPIILKWLSGSARHIGKPIHATVYTDEKVNDQIQVFYVDRYWSSNKKANNYLIHVKGYDSLGTLKYFNINLAEKWIGKPAATSKKDYDFIAGHFISKRNWREVYTVPG